MHRFTAVLTVVLAACAGASCSDSENRLTAPGGLSAIAAPTFSVTPTEVGTTTQLMRSTRVSCPAFPPLNFRLFVTVFLNGIADLAVRQFRIGFLDTSGTRMPQVTVPAPFPIVPFGSALEDTRDRLVFPLDVGIGCGTGTKGTLSVSVDTQDGHGTRRTGHLEVRVN
jgi:hypothetical protein